MYVSGCTQPTLENILSRPTVGRLILRLPVQSVFYIGQVVHWSPVGLLLLPSLFRAMLIAENGWEKLGTRDRIFSKEIGLL